MAQETSPRFRFRRVFFTSAGILAVLFCLQVAWTTGYHRYRIWKADGVWCALGNPSEGWQFGYGEEDCPVL